MKQESKLAVVGGGAAGMVAAIEAARCGAEVHLYESQNRLGRKLLATGNGRCNFSHRGFNAKNYHGKHAHFVQEALERYNEISTLDFFESLGLVWTVDARERYYPASLQAQAVLDILRMVLVESGVSVHTQTRISSLELNRNGSFKLGYKGGTDYAGAVIIATGGEAAPKLGGTRDGYKLLKKLGHSLVETAPGIVQLLSDDRSLVAANGLRREVSITLYAGQKKIAQETGELLITGYGISGPAVLQCAASAVRALARGEKVYAEINFFPEYEFELLVEIFMARWRARPQRDAGAFFVGFLPRLLAQCALKSCALKTNEALAERSLLLLAEHLHAWRLPLTGTRGFAEAQVTLGGIDTADFDAATMQSWIVPGLYAAGEVLDVDGDCGGYNLQWAWSSGRLAGASAAAFLTYTKK